MRRLVDPRSSSPTAPPADGPEKVEAHRRWQEVARKLALLKEDPDRYLQLHGERSAEP